MTVPNLLALQRTAGNAAVTALLARKAADVELTQTELDFALQQTRSRFNRTSIQTLQELLGGHADGKWTTSWVWSLARWQSEHDAEPANGQIATATLNALIETATAKSLETRVIHLLADFFDLELENLTSVRFADWLDQPYLVTGTQALGQVLIGPPAMANFSALKDALEQAVAGVAQPAAPGPSTGMPLDEAKRMIAANEQVLRDPRSIRGLQAYLRGEVTGRFEIDTSNRIADFQAREGLSTGKGDQGRLYDETLRRILDNLSNQHYHRDLVIRMVVDWYRIDERGVLDALYDFGQFASHTVKFTGRPGPGEITFGTEAFAYGHESLVHTVQQAFAEAHHHAAGTSPLQSKFLAARARVVSDVVDVFATDPNPLSSQGFVLDARQALDAFLALPQSLQERQEQAFESMRDVVVARYQQADRADQANHAQLLTDYRLVFVRPSPLKPVNNP